MMKILYFTATGNCLAVAKRFGAELLSIPQLLRQKQFAIEADEVGIVTPTHGLALPEVVGRYLRQCSIKADYIFVIATYGNMRGAVLHEVKRALAAGGNRADYYQTLLMVDNYLPLFEVGKQLAMTEKKATERHLQSIVGEVRGHTRRDCSTGMLWNGISAAMGAMSDSAVKSRARRWFRVADGCVGCGICAKVCPVANIAQQGKEKPQFGERCISCFACTHNCPQNVIRLTNERSAARFRNAEVSLREIIDSNCQQDSGVDISDPK